MGGEVVGVGAGRIPGPVSNTAAEITSGAASQAGSENFPVALRLLPARYRRHLAAVYGFARSADDMGDEAAPGERLSLLDELEADLDRLYATLPGADPAPAVTEAPPAAGARAAAGQAAAGQAGTGQAGTGQAAAGQAAAGQAAAGQAAAAEPPRLAVVAALGPAVTACAIPAQPFRDLIQANRQDQAVFRYPSFSDLLGYCRLSANPVGRIVLHVFGYATPERAELSDRVCTALQLAEHWQDVAEDYRAGRIYLPQEDLDRFGVSENDLAAAAAPPQLRALMEFEVRRARKLLDDGAPLTGTLRGAARAAVAGYVAGGRAALSAITAAGYDVLTTTPRPRKARLATELAKTYATGR